ncbi:MAG: hypothetical protein RBT41_03620 [Clostridia bacterium]|jgi:hypothetical protein|nr:hypothetical protein [Clostridia bacterium]
MNQKIHHYLIIFTIAALALTGLSFARYAKTIATGSEARVARVVFKYVPVGATLNGTPLSGLEDGLDISGALPGDELVYHFEIRNYDGALDNQVLMKYNISVVFSPDPTVLPLDYTLTPAGSYSSAGGGWTRMGFNGQETHGYTLTVAWDESEDTVNYLQRAQTMQLQIDAEQMDG